MIQKITLCIAFSFLACIGYSQDAPETQSTLVTKISATWCGPCGGWAWDFFHDLVSDNEEKATMVAVHHSGNLMTPTSSALADNFMISGQPQFYLGNIRQTVSSGTTAAKRTEIQTAVDDIADQSPIVNTGLIATINAAGEINVATNTKFFQAADANYYLGVYIVNDGYVGPQTGQGNNAEHEKVLVTAFTPSHFGEQITTGAVAAGTEFTRDYTIAADAAWNIEELEVITIIWSEANGVYTYENSNITTSIDLATNTEMLMDIVNDFSIEPTIMNGSKSTINFELFDGGDYYTINVMDQTGRLVKSVFEGELNAGRHRFEVERADLEVAGIYYVTIKSAAGQSTRELIIK